MRWPCRTSATTGLLVAACLLAGCAAVGSLFNPEFLTALSGSSQAASLPGDAPALVVAVENATNRPAEALVSYRTTAEGVDSFWATVEPYSKTAQALACPVEEITLGLLSDPGEPGVYIRLGGGTVNDPYIEVEPFGVILKDGINYDCGDSLTFRVQPSGATRSGYQTYVYIRRASEGE